MKIHKRMDVCGQDSMENRVVQDCYINIEMQNIAAFGMILSNYFQNGQ